MFLVAYLLCTALGLSVTGIQSLIERGDPVRFFILQGESLVIQIPTWVLLRRHPRAAAGYLVCSLGIFLTIHAWRVQIPTTPALFAGHIVVLAVAAFTLGRKWVFGYGMSLLAVLVGLAVFRSPVPASMTLPTPSPLGVLVGKIQIVVTTVTVLAVASWSFERALAHITSSMARLAEAKANLESALTDLESARAKERELNRELRALNDQLEERVAAQTKALQLANEDLLAFASRASHDLRAPVRAISGFAAVLSTEAPDPEGHLPRIRELTKKMDRMIQSIFRFSRLGTSGLNKEQVESWELVDQFARDCRADGLPTRFEVHELPSVEADRELLSLVWQNLLSNAVKYSSAVESPLVRVGSYERDGITIFRVEDNGIGLGTQGLEKLFEPFERLHGQQFEGVGLGLAMVRRILRLHGGDIATVPSDLGGAAFVFTVCGSLTENNPQIPLLSAF